MGSNPLKEYIYPVIYKQEQQEYIYPVILRILGF